jgi:hypothetical protein
MVQGKGTRTCADHDHQYRANFCCADGQELKHDALRVSDSTRVFGELENESKANSLGMAISD